MTSTTPTTYCDADVLSDGRFVLCSRPAGHPGAHNPLRQPEDWTPPPPLAGTTTTYTIPAKPTTVGQRVRFIGHGGRVAAWMVGGEGTVIRLTAVGNPVIQFEDQNYSPGVFYITDTYGCAALIDGDGTLIRTEVTVA
jgi:hypothetical protein